jgi:hypothetical protein
LIHIGAYWYILHNILSCSNKFNTYSQKKCVPNLNLCVNTYWYILILSKYDYLMLSWWLEMCWRPTWSAESRISPPTRGSAGRLSAFTLQHIAQKRPKISSLIGYNDTTQ